MRTIKLLLTFLLTIFLGAACCDEDPPSLPPETQTGEDILGCYVNNKLLITERGYGYLGASNPSAIFSRSTNSLGLYSAGRNGIIYTRWRN